jgi:hypothetical protein
VVEPGDLKQLPHQTSEAADTDLSAPVAQLFGDSDDCTKSHAANVREISKVQNQHGNPLRDAGLALRLERLAVFSVHSAGYTQHDLVPNQSSLDGHDRQKSASHHRWRQLFSSIGFELPNDRETSNLLIMKTERQPDT